MKYQPRLTHAARAARRKAIADAVAQGRPVPVVARAYRVAIPTVYLSMRLAGWPPAREGRPRKNEQQPKGWIA